MIKEEWNKQIRQAFIDALEYPLQAVPEFWANRQRDTGIYKHHFFGFMYKVCSDYLPGMPRVRKDLKNIHPAEPTLFEITDGRVDAVQTLDGERTQSLTRDLVLDLQYLITRAAEWYEEKPAYTDLQIVSFAQHAVQFVYKSFQKQGQTKAVMIGVKEYPPDFKGTSKEVLWADKQVLYRYSFYQQPDALFSYPQFEESLRKLILNSPNPDGLKRIVKPLYELGARIGDLWNDTVQPLEMMMGEEERPHEINEYKVFNAAERDWGTRGKSKEWHYRDEAGFIPLSNYELTLFAVRVSNLVANEVLGKKENALPVAPQKTRALSMKQIALIHVYNGEEITRANGNEKAAQYGYTAPTSGEALFQDYTRYRSTANRKGLPTPKTPTTLKNKIKLLESVGAHLSDTGRNKAKDDITILATHYQNEYP